MCKSKKSLRAGKPAPKLLDIWTLADRMQPVSSLVASLQFVSSLLIILTVIGKALVNGKFSYLNRNSMDCPMFWPHPIPGIGSHRVPRSFCQFNGAF